MGPRKEILELTCWSPLGGCSTASLPLCSAPIGPLVHDGAGSIGLLDARLTNMGVRHGALRAWVYSLVGIPRDDAVGQRLGVTTALCWWSTCSWSD